MFTGLTSLGTIASVKSTDAGVVLIILVSRETHAEINVDGDSASLPASQT
jgi:hypothetical protein